MTHSLKPIEQHASFGGRQSVWQHHSTVTDTPMTFAVYQPPQAEKQKCPVLYYLSGLTCNHANVMEKGFVQAYAAQHGIIVVMPDSSPRPEDMADFAKEDQDWQIGTGAGFYLDAVRQPWARHWQMESYITKELPEIINTNFPVEPSRVGIFGHSMGGHGALTLALKNPGMYRSCSAFAPISSPMAADWTQKAFAAYLGEDKKDWRAYDACALIEDGAKFAEFLVDQGSADPFLEKGTMPGLLKEACNKAGIDLTLRMQQGYDHSYYFISSFMEDHLAWHAKRLD